MGGPNFDSITWSPDTASIRSPFLAAVVIPTVLRASLTRAVRSVFRQNVQGRLQILLGIDRTDGDFGILSQLATECPNHCALTTLNLGYSTSIRNGSLYPAQTGGSLRTTLSFAANSRFVAYLDDDNWWDEDHLSSLLAEIQGNHWAFS